MLPLCIAVAVFVASLYAIQAFGLQADWRVAILIALIAGWVGICCLGGAGYATSFWPAQGPMMVPDPGEGVGQAAPAHAAHDEVPAVAASSSASTMAAPAAAEPLPAPPAVTVGPSGSHTLSLPCGTREAESSDAASVQDLAISSPIESTEGSSALLNDTPAQDLEAAPPGTSFPSTLPALMPNANGQDESAVELPETASFPQPPIVQGSSDPSFVLGISEAYPEHASAHAPPPAQDTAAPGGVPTPSEPPSTEAAVAASSVDGQQDSSAVSPTNSAEGSSVLVDDTIEEHLAAAQHSHSAQSTVPAVISIVNGQDGILMEVSEATTPLQPSVAQASVGHLGVQGIPEAVEQGPAQPAPAEVADVAAPMSPAAGITCLHAMASPVLAEPVSPQTATEAACAEDQPDSSTVSPVDSSEGCSIPCADTPAEDVEGAHHSQSVPSTTLAPTPYVNGQHGSAMEMSEVSEATSPLQPSVAQGISGHLSAEDIPEAKQQDPPQVALHEAPTPDMAAAGGLPTPSEPPSAETAAAATTVDIQQDSSAVRGHVDAAAHPDPAPGGSATAVAGTSSHAVFEPQATAASTMQDVPFVLETSSPGSSGGALPLGDNPVALGDSGTVAPFSTAALDTLCPASAAAPMLSSSDTAAAAAAEAATAAQRSLTAAGLSPPTPLPVMMMQTAHHVEDPAATAAAAAAGTPAEAQVASPSPSLLLAPQLPALSPAGHIAGAATAQAGSSGTSTSLSLSTDGSPGPSQHCAVQHGFGHAGATSSSHSAAAAAWVPVEVAAGPSATAVAAGQDTPVPGYEQDYATDADLQAWLGQEADQADSSSDSDSDDLEDYAAAAHGLGHCSMGEVGGAAAGHSGPSAAAAAGTASGAPAVAVAVVGRQDNKQPIRMRGDRGLHKNGGPSYERRLVKRAAARSAAAAVAAEGASADDDALAAGEAPAADSLSSSSPHPAQPYCPQGAAAPAANLASNHGSSWASSSRGSPSAPLQRGSSGNAGSRGSSSRNGGGWASNSGGRGSSSGGPGYWAHPPGRGCDRVPSRSPGGGFGDSGRGLTAPGSGVSGGRGPAIPQQQPGTTSQQQQPLPTVFNSWQPGRPLPYIGSHDYGMPRATAPGGCPPAAAGGGGGGGGSRCHGRGSAHGAAAFGLGGRHGAPAGSSSFGRAPAAAAAASSCGARPGSRQPGRGGASPPSSYQPGPTSHSQQHWGSAAVHGNQQSLSAAPHQAVSSVGQPHHTASSGNAGWPAVGSSNSIPQHQQPGSSGPSGTPGAAAGSGHQPGSCPPPSTRRDRRR